MTAVELLPPHQAVNTNPEWHRLRRAGISASEIAAVLGISRWDSPFSLYWSKVNDWRAEQSDEMSIGAAVEQAVADLWADRRDPHENLALAPAGLYASAAESWQLATPDRLVHRSCTECGDSRASSGWPSAGTYCWTCSSSLGQPRAVLECKWAGSWDGWGDDDTDDIPVYYRAQALWQCHVLDVDQWYLGVLGPSGFRSYSGHRDRADIAVMVEHGRRFMDRLNRLDPPDIDDGHPATTAALKRLHPSIEPGEVETTPEFADGWRRARALRKRAEDLCDRFEVRARHDLGHYHRLVCGGKLVASRSVFDQGTDQAQLTAIDTDWPTTDRLNPGRLLTHAR
jgi:putative phage-type endonuclease